MGPIETACLQFTSVVAQIAALWGLGDISTVWFGLVFI